MKSITYKTDSELSRIKPLDGLRVFAAFGVVWIHSWAYCNNPALKFGRLDFYKIIAIVGNGVDFFFVISGFFMFVILSNRKVDLYIYKNFLGKRWRRIAPAFYVSALVYTILYYINDSTYPIFSKLFFNFIFLNNFFPSSEIIGPFWSLSTEWQFYIILPILFIKRKSFLKLLCFTSVLSLFFLFIINIGFLNESYWLPQVFGRFIEFSWGILTAYGYKNKIKLPSIMTGYKGILLSLITTYAGRVCLTEDFINVFGKYIFLIKTVGLPLMTFGFAWLCYLVITEKSFLSKFLSLNFMQFLGKISFSVYLWHSFVFYSLNFFLKSLNGFVWSVPIVFLIISLGTIIISYFSYKYFEAPYFFKKGK